MSRCLSHPKSNHSGSIYYVPLLCYSFTYSLQAQNLKIVFILACSLLEIIFRCCFIIWIWNSYKRTHRNPLLYIWEYSVLGFVTSWHTYLYDKYKAHIMNVLWVVGRCLRLRPEYMRLLKHILASVDFILQVKESVAFLLEFIYMKKEWVYLGGSEYLPHAVLRWHNFSRHSQLVGPHKRFPYYFGLQLQQLQWILLVLQ